MTKRPKGVAQKHDRLPACDRLMPIPYKVYCPDLGAVGTRESWSYEPRDIPPGLQMVECFKPFLRHLLTLDLSRVRPAAPTPRQLVGSGRRDHPPIADGQRPPETAHRAGRWRSHRRRGWPAALPRRARGRAARPSDATCRKVFALPGRCREPPRPRAKPSATYDEPSEPLTAPMQTARPRGSRSSPAAARAGAPRKAQGLTASRVDEAQLAVPTGAEIQPIPLHRRTTPPRCRRPNRPPITHKFSPGTKYPKHRAYPDW